MTERPPPPVAERSSLSRRQFGRWNLTGQALLSIPLILLPSTCLVMGVLLIWGVFPRIIDGMAGRSQIHPALWGLSAVLTAALFAVPGYFVAAFEPRRLGSLSRGGRGWVRSSLIAGALAAVVAIPMTFYFGPWLWLLPAGTLLACMGLVLRSEILWRTAGDRPQADRRGV